MYSSFIDLAKELRKTKAELRKLRKIKKTLDQYSAYLAAYLKHAHEMEEDSIEIIEERRWIKGAIDNICAGIAPEVVFGELED